MNVKDSLELYIHIPFCVKKCAYCDFLSFPAEEADRVRYTEALKREIAARAEEAGERQVTSIFFGGGTPTVLPAEELVRILTLVKEYYQVEEAAEITLEANPGTVTEAGFWQLKEGGFNRLSFGLQSTRAAELALLGRIHSYGDFLEALDGAKKAGFVNISADLMFALPGQDRRTFAESLERVGALGLTHISAYSLILEEGTPLYEKKDSLSFPSEEEYAGMYEDCAAILSAYGFSRYEISNYAKEGFACRHNTGYWTGIPYLGLGLGASSYTGDCRFRNTRSMAAYLERAARPALLKEDVQLLTEEDAMSEYMILGLRLTEGVSITEFARRFGREFDEIFGAAADRYLRTGFMERTKDRIRLTDKGFPVSNYILADFMP